MKSYRARGLAFLAKTAVGILSMSLSHLALAAGPGWFNNFEQAAQTARQQGRPIFVDFSTSWCSVCKQMDRTTLADPVVIGRLDNFVKVKVDGDARPDLVNAYGVEAYPTFLHLDANGRVMEKREGFMRVQEMAGTLDRTWQSVSTSMAIAQANLQNNPQQPQNVHAAPQAGGPQVASTDLQLLPMESQETTQLDTRGVSRGDGASDASGSLYNITDPQLQGGRNVYATDAGPSSERRSRFGGGITSNLDLRQLAEATAQPGAMEATFESTKAEEPKAAELAKAEDEKSEAVETGAVEKAATDKKAAEKATEMAAGKAQEDAEKQALAAPPVEVARAAPSPVIESRLSGLADSELPKPLLSRTASGATQSMKPATIVSVSSEKDPLATIRRIQGDDGAARPVVATKTQPIAAELVDKPEPETKPDTPKAEEKAPATTASSEKKPAATSESVKEPSSASREVASATVSKKSSSAVDKTEETETSTAKKTKAKETVKTAEGATRDDIERWMKDADSKLVSDRKKEARAMYTKVVEKDPKNQFGKSDMAYVKMVSLIVDRDSDRLRMEAYSKIKEFEARYPSSDHKDYYTLIRAILATDLGETNEAHKLLGTFADRFPDSKYKKIAHDTWKDLPPVKKESSTKSASSSSSKSKKSSS